MKEEYKVEIRRDDGNVRALFTGRLDAISAENVQKTFESLIDDGERVIIADLTNVSYISSAGIRAFIFIQKKLRVVSGEIVLYNPQLIVNNIFTVSGLDKLFSILSAGQKLPVSTEKHLKEVKDLYEGITFECLHISNEKGKLHHFGNGEKLKYATYAHNDVVTKKSSEIPFGIGLAATGEEYGEYSGLFGEAMVIDGNFFFYPTVHNPVVDFILKKHGGMENKLNFLHGFSFSGPWRSILSFNDCNSFIEFPRLKKAIFNYAKGNLLGIVFLIESRGYWGISLKKSPVIENRVPEGKTIFDSDLFPDWFDYPVEAGESKHILVGTGILARSMDKIDEKLVSLFPEKSEMHIHAGVFKKGHISRKAEDFEKELARILDGQEPRSIYHILGKTRFISGLMGIIELEE